MERFSTSSPSYEPASRLLVGKNGAAVHLSNATALLLEALIEAGPGGASRKELHQRIWGHDYASDDALNHLVSRLRRKIKASGSKDDWRIETIPLYGYRLCQRNANAVPLSWRQRLVTWLISQLTP